MSSEGITKSAHGAGSESAHGGLIKFTDVRDFDPDQIFDCGQCFRWEPVQDAPAGAGRPSGNTWRGVVGNRLAEATYFKDVAKLEIRDSLLATGNCTADAAEKFWWNYFDLGRDYGEIKSYLTREGDSVMAEAVKSGSGIRILNQDRWETLISFIISQNNNIPRIKKCIEALAETAGKPIQLPQTWPPAGTPTNDPPAGTPTNDPPAGGPRYALPTPDALARASVEDLAPCRLGYRDKYLIETARRISGGGYCSDTGACSLLDEISAEKATNSQAIERLRCFCGVGPKVANCVALFCLGQIDSFPLDVWMKRVMNRLYGIPENDMKAMKEYADLHFAPYGGIAQQYLFHYIINR